MRFSWITSIVAAAWLCLGCAMHEEPSMTMTITPSTASYVGTYTNGSSKGIYCVAFDSTTGSLGEPRLVAELANPSFLTTHPTLPVLYAVSEVGRFDDVAGGGVVAYHIDADGSLREVARRTSGGDGPCYVSVDRAGRTLFVANYGGGTVASYPLDPVSGIPGAPASIDRHDGSGADPKRQSRAYAHSLVADPSGRFALSCDLGMDSVLIYKLDASRGAIERVGEAKLPPGSGPRHMAFSTDGKTAYVVNELSNTVARFDWDANAAKLTLRQTIGTLPASFGGQSTTAEIVVHPSGRFVYASNRGDDSIARFRVDATSGELTDLGQTKTGGASPRNFAIDLTGQFLVVGNQKSDMLAVFRIDRTNGDLTPTAGNVKLGAPACVRFVR